MNDVARLREFGNWFLCAASVKGGLGDDTHSALDESGDGVVEDVERSVGEAPDLAWVSASVGDVEAGLHGVATEEGHVEPS